VDLLYPVFLALIVGFTLWGVFCEAFEDTLLQRIGMAFICSSAVFGLYNEFFESNALIEYRSRMLLSIGVLCYAIGTAIDVHRKHRRIRKRINQQ
jgi:hypothetical protein